MDGKLFRLLWKIAWSLAGHRNKQDFFFKRKRNTAENRNPNLFLLYKLGSVRSLLIKTSFPAKRSSNSNEYYWCNISSKVEISRCGMYQSNIVNNI